MPEWHICQYCAKPIDPDSNDYARRLIPLDPALFRFIPPFLCRYLTSCAGRG